MEAGVFTAQVRCPSWLKVFYPFKLVTLHSPAKWS
uniref:Uncharacterized protein n=1 Tax=Anguilla anguilla TaxID=7936 RepID=A0A0E9TD96_ANGAN